MYIVNSFKEIIGIFYYNGSSSSLICSLEAIYIYDAWGNHQVYNGSGLIDNDPYSIGNINPFRFKGYYYDKETNLYYLMSRYYDPSIGQFISPDDYTYLDINKVSGYHLYAYCNNNPVMNEDPDGHIAIWATLLIGAVIGLVVGGTESIVKQAIDNHGDYSKFDWGDFAQSLFIGSAIGFAGAAGSIFLGGAIAGEVGASVAAGWFGISSSVGATAGVAGYVAKQLIHQDEIKIEGIIVDGLLTSVLAAASYGASGLAGSIDFPSKGRFFSPLWLMRRFTEDIFANPISWLLDPFFQ